ncbi:MAG: hypothetical protein RL595_2271 [Planctomycetota bacterium]|jgi:hypothetical protein
MNKRRNAVEVAKNPLGEDVAASLALAGRHIFVRGGKQLWCVGK